MIRLVVGNGEKLKKQKESQLNVETFSTLKNHHQSGLASFQSQKCGQIQ